MAKKNNQAVIPAVVAVVAIVGMVMLSSGNGTGLGSFASSYGEGYYIEGTTWQYGPEHGAAAAQQCPATDEFEWGECCSARCAESAGQDNNLRETCSAICKQMWYDVGPLPGR